MINFIRDTLVLIGAIYVISVIISTIGGIYDYILCSLDVDDCSLGE